MAEYTPDTAHVREQYTIDAEDHIEGAEKVAEFDRFLARVRRDAAREALDELAGWHQETADLFDEHSEFPGDRARHDESLNRRAETLAYRDTHYPEETA